MQKGILTPGQACKATAKLKELLKQSQLKDKAQQESMLYVKQIVTELLLEDK